MKFQTITVSSSRKVPHPGIDFANLTAHASITAQLEEGDAPGYEAEILQQLVDAVVDTHIDGLLDRHAIKPRPAKAAEATQNTASALAAKHGKVVQ